MTWVSGKGRLVADPTSDPREGEEAMEGHPIVQCHEVTKSFGAVSAVRDFSMALESGEILALVGPSGSGKTTFLRLLAGFEIPSAGTLRVEDRLVAGAGNWVPPEDRRLGMVFQDYALFPHMTVAQNVVFGLKGWARRSKVRRAREVLEIVRLSHLEERYPYQLSGGEQQRVALARSLAPQPLALLLDEPFSNLDPQLRLRLRTEVKDILRSSGVTSVYVTHDQEEALFMGDRVAVMNEGRLEQVGTPEDIFHHPKTRFVAQFLGIADFLPAMATEDGLTTEIGLLRTQDHLPPGTEIDAMVRPDDIAIRASDTGPGRVVGRVFRGMHYLYVIALPSGVSVHSLQHHSAYYPDRASVDIYLEPNQTLTCFMRNDSSPSPTFQVSTSNLAR